jgi:RNA polymerase sigma-70 factor (ECF subfamily)
MAAVDAKPVRGPELADDAALVKDLAAFDAGAWRVLFDTYYARIFSLAYLRLHDRPAAEDVAADVFAEAARGISRYRYRGVPFRAWLFRIASNLIADQLKLRRRRPQLPLDEAADVASSPTDFATRADFMRGLQRLTPDQQEVLVLRFVSECTLAEVALITGRTVNAVKQLQHRAVRSLRQSMSTPEEERL